MSEGNYQVKIRGAEGLGLSVTSEHISDITETCMQEDNLDRSIPLFFYKGRELKPIDYLLIGAKVSRLDQSSEQHIATFKTNIQLADSREVDELFERLTPFARLAEELGSTIVSISHQEYSIGLLDFILFEGERIPKKPWLEFLGGSFACLIEINRIYTETFPEHGPDTAPRLGAFVVGSIPA